MENETDYTVKLTEEIKARLDRANAILAQMRDDLAPAIDWANLELGKLGLGPLTVSINIPMKEPSAPAEPSEPALDGRPDIENLARVMAPDPDRVRVFRKTVYSPRPYEPEPAGDHPCVLVPEDPEGDPDE